MEINGSLPMHIARAYGVNPAARSKPTTAVQAPTQTTRIQPPDAYAPAQSNSKINALIAGRVDQPIDFTPSPAPQSQTLQMYTRAADRIEAATSVQIGRSLDVRG